MKSPTMKINENRFLGNISASSFRNLLPGSISAKRRLSNSNPKSFKSNDENAPPVIDPNIQANYSGVQFMKQSPKKSMASESKIPRSDGHDEVIAPAKSTSQNDVVGTITCAEVKESLDPTMKVVASTHPVNEENEQVVNEKLEKDDGLGHQIRHLKEELVRAKSKDSYKSVGSCYFTGLNARDSLSQLRVSLNRSLVLPHVDNADEEEVSIDANDVHELHQQFNKLHCSHDENLRSLYDNRDSVRSSFASASCEVDVMSEDEICSQDSAIIEIEAEKSKEVNQEDGALVADNSTKPKTSWAIDPALRSSISISPRRPSPILEEPILSESPKIRDTRKSMAVNKTTYSDSHSDMSQSSNFKTFKQTEEVQCSSLSSKLFPGPTDSLAASLQKGLQIIDNHRRSLAPNRSSVSFSFEHLTLKPSEEVDKLNASVQMAKEDTAQTGGRSSYLVCPSCRHKSPNEIKDSLKTWIVTVDEPRNPSQQTNQEVKCVEDATQEASRGESKLRKMCMEQAAKIEQLTRLLEEYKHRRQNSSMDEEKLLICSNVEDYRKEVIKETYEMELVDDEYDKSDLNEKEALLKEIADLKSKLHSHSDLTSTKSIEKLRSSLLSRSIQLRKGIGCQNNGDADELEKERERWTEMESEWISLTDELRLDIDSQRRRAEKVEMELEQEKKCTEELNDALQRAVLGHSRFIEQYTELQEKYDDLAEKHRAIMEGIADIKKAAAKAGAKGHHGSRFAKKFAAELKAIKVEKEKEREFLKKENKSLKAQLRDTAEAVHAAGELLVRLREAEQAASVAEDNFNMVKEENENLKKQIDKLKNKHKTEMTTMKQYLAESRLPGSALQPWQQEEPDVANHSTGAKYDDYNDDQAWRAEFGAIYQDHY